MEGGREGEKGERVGDGEGGERVEFASFTLYPLP